MKHFVAGGEGEAMLTVTDQEDFSVEGQPPTSQQVQGGRGVVVWERSLYGEF